MVGAESPSIFGCGKKDEYMNLNKRIAIAAVAASAMAAHGRSLIHYFDFDTLNGSGLAYTDVDKGTSPADFTLKQNGTAYAPYTSGALGSDHAFYSSSKTCRIYICWFV